MQKPFSTQPALFVTSADLEHPSLHGLEGAEAVLDWQELEQVMAGIYASKIGRPSYPLLTLLRASLLGIWYRLSDVELAQTLFRDLLFRKFCHLELGGNVPDASTIGRFRNKLVEHDLWEVLLGEVNRRLEERHIIMTEGRINIIDATPIEAAQSGSGKGADGQPKRDRQAGWHVKADSRGNMKSTFGYSVHTGVPSHGLQGQTTARQWMRMVLSTARPSPPEMPTTALNVTRFCSAMKQHCMQMLPTHHAPHARNLRFGIEDQVQRKGYRGHPLSEPDRARNDEIAVIRAGGERPFAAYKSRYGLARTRLMGLTRNLTFYGLAAVAHNIQKGSKFLIRYGLPEPTATG